MIFMKTLHKTFQDTCMKAQCVKKKDLSNIVAIVLLYFLYIIYELNFFFVKFIQLPIKTL